MFILNKKRMFIVLFAFTLTISVISIKNKKTIETNTWSVPKKTIVLDAGHGLPDERSIK